MTNNDLIARLEGATTEELSGHASVALGELLGEAAAALREAQERIATEVVAYNSTVDALNAARLYAEDDRDKWESCATTAMAALDEQRARAEAAEAEIRTLRNAAVTADERSDALQALLRETQEKLTRVESEYHDTLVKNVAFATERDALHTQADDSVGVAAEAIALLKEVVLQLPDWFDNGNGLHCRIQKALGDKYA